MNMQFIILTLSLILSASSVIAQIGGIGFWSDPGCHPVLYSTAGSYRPYIFAMDETKVWYGLENRTVLSSADKSHMTNGMTTRISLPALANVSAHTIPISPFNAVNHLLFYSVSTALPPYLPNTLLVKLERYNTVDKCDPISTQNMSIRARQGSSPDRAFVSPVSITSPGSGVEYIYHYDASGDRSFVDIIRRRADDFGSDSTFIGRITAPNGLSIQYGLLPVTKVGSYGYIAIAANTGPSGNRTDISVYRFSLFPRGPLEIVKPWERHDSTPNGSAFIAFSTATHFYTVWRDANLSSLLMRFGLNGGADIINRSVPVNFEYPSVTGYAIFIQDPSDLNERFYYVGRKSTNNGVQENAVLSYSVSKQLWEWIN